MKAMIFAAGLGTRLKPFTDCHPKALAPVAGVPVLGRVIKKLKDAGISDFVVNVHHFSQQILDYLTANDNFGVNIQISDESGKLLETGGGILAAADMLANDDILIHNADILTDFDIREMMAQHRSTASAVTLLAAQRDTRRYLLFDRESLLMKGWTDISTGKVRPDSLEISAEYKLLAFGGVHIISPEILSHLSEYARKEYPGDSLPEFSIMDFYIDICQKYQIRAFTPSQEYQWFDIGKPESLAAAENALLRNSIN